LNINTPELKKPAGVWCEHCSPGKGCAIYETRFPICRTYKCGWLLGFVPEHWFPAKSKIVVSFAKGFLCFFVDPSVPGRWREPEFYERIKSGAVNGHDKGEWFTYTVVGARAWAILPDEDVELPGGRYTPHEILTDEHGKVFVKFEE
jgi:hypothetical protein